MTEEEIKAEEYFCEHCENSFEHDNGHCSNCSKWDYFIAGLTEGKPKWHDLRKDPNDLPKEIQICSNPVYVISRGGSSDLAQYDYRQRMWCYKYSNEHILYEVIAWCEEPKFEE